MDYNKELKRIINKQQNDFPQIRKKQQEILINENLYKDLKKVEYVIYKGENNWERKNKSQKTKKVN